MTDFEAWREWASRAPESVLRDFRDSTAARAVADPGNHVAAQLFDLLADELAARITERTEESRSCQP